MKDGKTWALAALIALVTFFGLVKPRLAAALTRDEVHGLYLASVGVKVGDYLDENGWRQIEYEFETERIKLTEGNLTSANPDTKGEWIAWMTQIAGSWQIFLFNLTSETKLQLTNIGNNVNPSVSRGYVAWEGLVAGTWQVFLFDGIDIRQVTQGESVSDTQVNDEWLVYRQRDPSTTTWRLKVQSLITNEIVDLGEGMEPQLSEDKLTWKEVFGNRIETREFWFNPEASPTPSVSLQPTQEATPSAIPTETNVTEPEVILEASESAQVAPTASESGELQ